MSLNVDKLVIATIPQLVLIATTNSQLLNHSVFARLALTLGRLKLGRPKLARQPSIITATRR